ncbi:adenylate/guanylate cyclase domain-containing protein [bacterium]|nr:MAG: adenylate/guanylate cyclase domain-containing protein [bacterium]
MIRPPVGRHLRYWYTYRTAVAGVIALALSAAVSWLYTQQIACDAHTGCVVNVSVHPEDRFAGQTDPGNGVVIVGIDNRSVQTIGQYPVPRDVYATALRNLEIDGATVVAFDVNFPDRRDPATDGLFAQALAGSAIPVVLSYSAQDTLIGDGRLIQTSPNSEPPGIDEIPLKEFRCTDTNPDPSAPCRHPDPNVILASTDLVLDADGVVRRIPLFVQPACFATGACDSQVINSFGVAAYGAASLGTDFKSTSLQHSGGSATFGAAWSIPVDQTGSIWINFSGPPGNFKKYGHYIPLADVVNGTASPDAIRGRIVLVGYYQLTGVNDQQLVTTSAGSNGTQPMAGVEIHANVVRMLLGAVPAAAAGSAFLTPEPPILIFMTILGLGLLMALAVARLSILWGLLATVVAMAVFTSAVAYLAANHSFVPDVFHPLLTIALAYTGVTAYRFLYEDREKRKVTAIFGQYLKPEIVTQLARKRRGVEDIMRGGERRDITLLFVDVRGFTSMSESMAAGDVVNLVQMYLDHLSGIIFSWDGTVDKYVGDEIVAFWNAPRLQENHALLAVRCAYDLINRAPELQQRLLAKGLPPIRWGIGINTGPAVVGNMGSRSRIQYTALGDTVNTAARFCATAPAYHLLIGQPTYDLCQDHIAVDTVPGVELKGKSAQTFRIYRVTAIRETPTSPWVPFPTDMATQAHQAFTQQYAQQAVIAAGSSGSGDIRAGEAAGQAPAGQGPPAG